MASEFSIEEYEKLNPTATVNYEGKQILYAVPNRMTLWRAQTLLEKEPETIAWINSFSPGDVLVDIGANVGMYTVWAAMIRRVHVFAFEPEARNYALLNQNIWANGLSQTVTAYCVALSNETKFDKLYLSSPAAGESCHSFGQQVDYHLQPRNTPFVQGCYSVTLDSLIEEGFIQPPNHIKIDVDGFEHKVIAGAERTLKRTELRSVLIEINTNLKEHLALVEQLRATGFRYSQQQVDKSCETEGDFAGLANYIFLRENRIERLQPHVGGTSRSRQSSGLPCDS